MQSSAKRNLVFSQSWFVQTTLAALFFASSTTVAGNPVGTLEKTFPIMTGRLFADPNQPYVYAAITGGLDIINTDTFAIKTVALPNFAFGFAISQDGSLLYMSTGSNDSVMVLDTQTDSLVTTLPVGQETTSVAVGTNNRLWIYSDPEGQTASIYPVSASTGLITGSAITGGVESGGTLLSSPDHSVLYLGDTETSNVSAFNATAASASLSASGEEPATVEYVLSPDGSQLAFLDDQSSLHEGFDIYNAENLADTAYVPNSYYPNSIAFSPNGQFIYLADGFGEVDIYSDSGFNHLGTFQVATSGIIADNMVTDATGSELFLQTYGPGGSNPELEVYSIPEPAAAALVIMGSLVLLKRKAPRKRVAQPSLSRLSR